MSFRKTGIILATSFLALSFSAYHPVLGQDDSSAAKSQVANEMKVKNRDNSVPKKEEVSKNPKATAKEELSSKKTTENKKENYKDLVEKKKVEQKKADQAMLKAANEIDGVNIDESTFEEKEGFRWNHLNPFHWIFKPVTDMQKRVIHLEKQMMRLEAPIASLQKPMVGLRKDMVTVENQLDSVDNGMTDVNSHMKNVNSSMKSVETRLSHVERQLDQIYEPVVKLQKPVTSVGSQLTTLKKDLHELKDVVSLTSTLILVAVIAVGFLIAVGTPVAALFAWRHRRFIIEKFGNSNYEDVPMTEEDDAITKGNSHQNMDTKQESDKEQVYIG